MIDPSFDTVDTEPRVTTDDLMQVQIDNLTTALARKTEQWEFASSQLQKRVAQIEAFEQELKNNSWDFDGETLNDLASYFDITLEREYSVEIMVRFSGTVTVPMDYDIDDLENDLSAEITTHHYGNSSVDVDFMEEGMEISYEEI